MINKFLLNYTGSKYNETHYLINTDFNKYDTIIECFGGSYGFSRFLYKELNYKNKKYIVYDNNKELIDYYLHIQELINNNELNNFLKEYNEINDYLINNFRYKESKRRIISKESLPYVEKIKNKYLRFMLKQNIYLMGFSDIYYKNEENLDKDFLDMFKNITFIYSDIRDIDFSKYNKEKTLFYLDPPYILDNNKDYANCDSKFNFIDKIIYLLNNYNSLMIHSYNYLIHYVFKKYYFDKYDKKYKHRKKNTKDTYIIYYNEIY